VSCGQRQITFAMMAAQARKLAWRLCHIGVLPGAFVGLFFERSLEMVISQVAVLANGSAYVPLEPELPPERLQFALADSAVGLVLSHTACAAKLPASVPSLLVDRLQTGPELVLARRKRKTDEKAEAVEAKKANFRSTYEDIEAEVTGKDVAEVGRRIKLGVRRGPTRIKEFEFGVASDDKITKGNFDK